jgi:transposase
MLWHKSIHMKEPSGEMALKHQINEARYMKELLKSILLDIKHLSETDKYRENVRLHRSIPGIAILTAMTILTEIEDINRFPNAERFSSFVGLIPMIKSNGEKQKVEDRGRR